MMNHPIPLRYAVLHHTGIDPPHFDLMFETTPGSKLSTWRCPHWPPQSGDIFAALGDHRREYLEYEGAVSGNRGHVNRVAAGRVLSLEESGNQTIVTLDDSTRIALPKLR